jgi:hypothetical protein
LRHSEKLGISDGPGHAIPELAKVAEDSGEIRSSSLAEKPGNVFTYNPLGPHFGHDIPEPRPSVSIVIFT